MLLLLLLLLLMMMLAGKRTRSSFQQWAWSESELWSCRSIRYSQRSHRLVLRAYKLASLWLLWLPNTIVKHTFQLRFSYSIDANGKKLVCAFFKRSVLMCRILWNLCVVTLQYSIVLKIYINLVVDCEYDITFENGKNVFVFVVQTVSQIPCSVVAFCRRARNCVFCLWARITRWNCEAWFELYSER